MANPLITTSLVLLTLLAGAASVLAVRRLRNIDRGGSLQSLLVAACGVGAAALFLARWLGPGGRWQPLTAHVDGLLLIAALFAGLILFIQWRPRLFGLSAFATPLLAMLLAWGICASAWTYHPFHLGSLHPVWNAVHLAGVYLGTLGSALAAIAGCMYLYVQWRLKRKVHLEAAAPLASLETLERLIVHAATLGFALLTVGLIAGLVIFIDAENLAVTTGYFRWKLALAFGAWLIYALLMNVRYASNFRGARAAWLSILGLALLMATYGVVSALPAGNDVSGSESRIPGSEPRHVQASDLFDPGPAPRRPHPCV